MSGLGRLAGAILANLTVLAVLATASHGAIDEYRLEPTDFVGNLPASIRGPAQAKGAVIWNHGRHNIQGSSEYPAPPIAAYFSQSGWDVFAMRRIAYADRADEARRFLIRYVEELRGRGYTRFILMGQSAGAWMSLQVAGNRDDIEGVVALAPACCGRRGESSIFDNNADELYPLLRRLTKTKVTIAFFAQDEYDPGGRGTRAVRILAERQVPHYIINEPSFSYMTGHGAGQSYYFSRRFGACIYRFIETGVAPNCNDDPAGFAALGIVPPPGLEFDTGSPYAGVWSGTWDNSGRVVAIVVEKVNATQAKGYYIVGPGAAPEREKPELSKIEMSVGQDGLTWGGKTVTFTMKPQPDGTMAGTRTPSQGAAISVVLRKSAPQ